MNRFINSLLYLEILSLSTILAAETPTSAPLVTTQQSIPEDLLTIVIMIKNEAPVIEPTLKPFIDAGLQSFFVLDTGSTDTTVELAKKLFEQNHVQHAIIKQEAFVNFEISRNRTLDLADQNFPRSTFYLFLDADWYIQNTSGLIQFCKDHATDPTEAYFIRLNGVGNSKFHLYKPVLMRRDAHARFKAVVHEYLNTASLGRIPDSIHFLLTCDRTGDAKTKQRYHRDLVILKEEFERNPSDSRTVFYLAQTYACLGDLHTAYSLYKLRTEMKHGFDEEIFQAYFKMGLIQNALRQRNPLGYPWETELSHYLNAYQARPTRAESLVMIADYYRRIGSYPLCFLFARQSLDIPYPSDVNDVEDVAYEYMRYDLVSVSALHVGAYDIGEWATRQALQAHPDAQELYARLDQYLKIKEQIQIQNAERAMQQLEAEKTAQPAKA